MVQAEHPLPADLFLDLERSGPVPMYYQVASRLEKAITEGTLPAGARLENEVALGLRLGLSRPTIRRAIQELVDKGLLVRRRGVGTQVVHGRVTRNVELSSLYEDLESSGQTPETRILDCAVVPADAHAAAILDIAPGSATLHLRRLRLADGVPIAILENTLPTEFSDLAEGDLAGHGLYQLLRARGVTMRVANQRIGAREATAEEAALLGIRRGSAVLTMSRTVFDNSGRAVEFGQHCYRPDRYSFEVTLVNR
ncbi:MULTISPECIES: GntR family transcriptional regulator [Leifsonia]|nr:MULTISPECIES: GntR family transcriptional regulator [Leifsonia]SEA34681.1 transcriptional regulator, GntR family [Leifsonia sp. 21MFCrub1.1]